MLEDRKKCLETRVTSEGFVRRRYQMVDGTRLTTYEVPSSVYTALGRKRFADAMGRAVRGSNARSVAESRRKLVKTLTERGESVAQIAKAAGITDARVRQIIKEIE